MKSKFYQTLVKCYSAYFVGLHLTTPSHQSFNASSIHAKKATTSFPSVSAWLWWYTGPAVVGNVSDNSQQLSSACMHLKHNSCRMPRQPTPCPFVVIYVELRAHSRQPMTGRLASCNTALSAQPLSSRFACSWHSQHSNALNFNINSRKTR